MDRASERIGAAIQAAVAKGRPALVGYLTAGFPNRRQFKENLAVVAGGCDVVEIGVPFSDPMADGATIQRASFAALADGVTLPWILEELKSIEPRHRAPILLMSYLNPLLAFGMEQLPGAAARAGVAGFIVPGSAVRGKRRFAPGARSRRIGVGADGHARDAAGPFGDAVPGSQGLCLRRDHDGHDRKIRRR